MSHKISGWTHLALLGALCLVAVMFTLSMIQGLTLLHLLMIPGAMIFSSVMEYVIHRYPMHQMPNFLVGFYKQHSGIHHRYFTYKHMQVDDGIDLNEALTNTRVTVMLFAFIIIPMSLLLGLFIANLGLLFFATTTSYFIFYELTHLVTHLPATNFLTKLPYFRGACKRHRVHHNTKLMHKWNFNVSFPLLDKIFGTLIK